MLLISSLANCSLRYYYNHDFQLLLALLNSSSFRIRAFACATMVHELSYNEKENYEFEDFNTLVKLNLIDEEYRLSMSAFLAKLSIRNLPEQDILLEKSYRALLENWVGNETLVKRTITILSGRLPYNRSFIIAINFLNPLISAGVITNKFCFEYWNLVFHRKIIFHKKYLSGSSDTIIDHFCPSTDFELTNTIIYYFSQLLEVEQLKILKQSFEVLNPMWQIINKPFALHSSFNSFDGSSERVYWLKTILELLIVNNLINGEVLNHCNDFLASFKAEIDKITRYLNNLSYCQVLNIKENFKMNAQNN